MMTDSAISRKKVGVEGRKLERWVPDSNDAQALEGLELKDGRKSSNSGTGWDQFETNKKLYGVETSYDENLYTTALKEPVTEQDREIRRHAERLALEMEREQHSTASRNVRDCGDDGGYNDGDEADEETRFSSVVAPGRAPSTQVTINVPALLVFKKAIKKAEKVLTQAMPPLRVVKLTRNV